jgi:hypothetical protein
MARRRAIGADAPTTPTRTQLGHEKSVVGALIRRLAMLSTAVNPIDGHRFDGDADSFADDDVHP